MKKELFYLNILQRLEHLLCFLKEEWNSLNNALRNLNSVNLFKSKVKSFLFDK